MVAVRLTVYALLAVLPFVLIVLLVVAFEALLTFVLYRLGKKKSHD